MNLNLMASTCIPFWRAQINCNQREFHKLSDRQCLWPFSLTDNSPATLAIVTLNTPESITGDAIKEYQNVVAAFSTISSLDHHLLLIQQKHLVVVSLDLPTSHMALTSHSADEFTQAMLKAINGMMHDMLEAIARKDYQGRRRRQEEGIVKAKAAGKFKGRQPEQQLHAKILELRVKNNQSIRDTARLCEVSERTVILIVKQANNDNWLFYLHYYWYMEKITLLF